MPDTAAHVLRVLRDLDDPQQTYWTFDATPANYYDTPPGLQILHAGTWHSGVASWQQNPGELAIFYPVLVDVGDQWRADPPPAAAWFSPPRILGPPLTGTVQETTP